jgi:hypothetical protein
MMHRDVYTLEGKPTNLLAYVCDGGDCDTELRDRLQKYTNKITFECRAERDREAALKDNQP